MAGTLGALQVMEKNLNIEMGRGERARGTGEQVKSFRTGAALRVCSSRAQVVHPPRGRQSTIGFQGGAVHGPGARENHPWRLFLLMQGCLKAWHLGSNTELLPSSLPQNGALIALGSLAATSWLRRLFKSPAFLQP